MIMQGVRERPTFPSSRWIFIGLPLGRPRYRWGDNINMDLKFTGFD
jgi:hypothetical protein